MHEISCWALQFSRKLPGGRTHGYLLWRPKKIEFESTLVQEVDESLLRWNIKLFTSKCERSIYFQLREIKNCEGILARSATYENE